MENITCTLRFFGLPCGTVEHRLGDLLTDPSVTAYLTCDDEDVTLFLSAADEAALQAAVACAADRMNVYLYSRDGKELAARVVELLDGQGMTLAAAESCTGGLVASALTAVPGCSRVFGTGVVSYSLDCKEKLLRVRKDTLKAHGAVSRETAGEMARGVRVSSGADLGISITGEAGPNPSEDHPVGTVFIALADDRRTWVQELHLDDGVRDRNAIRRAASAYALDLVRRYLEAYPAVMAGGMMQSAQPVTETGSRLRFPNLFPRRQDGFRKNLLKVGLWLLILLVVAGLVLGGYQLAQAPATNRRLQDDLRGLYWSDSSSLSNIAQTQGEYPSGMQPRFRSLYDINPDIGGWIRIPDTVVDYPVMTLRDGYYSNHSFADELSYYGQPYFSVNELRTDGSEKALFIYGNNTRDEQMFSSLLSYRRLAYLQENAVVEMNTLYRSATWQIFAVAAVDAEDADFDYTQITDRESYLRQLRARSLFNSDVKVGSNARLLLLSTDAQREYGRDGARLLVAAVEITGTAPSVRYTVNWDARMPASWTTRARTTTTAQQETNGDSILSGDRVSATTTTTATTTVTQETTTTTTTTTASSTTTTTTEAEKEETTTTTTAKDTAAGDGPESDEETETEDNADLGN